MSDFLTRLVMHAGRALDVVRPRPVARFEDPVPPAAALGDEEIRGPAIPSSRAPSVTSGEQSEQQRASREAAPTRPTVVREPRTAIIDRVTVDRSPAPPPHPTVQAAPLRMPESPPATRFEIVRRDSTHAIARAPAQVVRAEAGPRHPVPDRPSASHMTTPPQAPDRPPSVAPAPPRVPLLKPSSVAAVTDRREAVPVRPSPERPDQSDVTVEITIGRVDVRAVMPQRPTAREPRASGPELSLDEYLQQRGRRT